VQGSGHLGQRPCVHRRRRRDRPDGRLPGPDAKNDGDRLVYEQAKRELAARDWARDWKYVQHYADAKSDVVAETIGRAMAARTAGDEPR
jgi:hypothetical protein